MRIETLKVDNLEPFRAPYAEFRFQEMNRTRFYSDIQFLQQDEYEPLEHHAHEKAHSEQLQCVIPALQNLTERRFTSSTNVLVNRLQCLNRT